jgi:adenylate cyclase
MPFANLSNDPLQEYFADGITAELIDPKIAEHHGRLVKTTGDGLLVEFSSVVDAPRCATEMQAGIV